MYSSIWPRKRSTWSSRCRNHGTYSLECSEDSVGKYPNRRNSSTRTRRPRPSGSASTIRRSLGYRSSPVRRSSKVYTKHWWLKPAVTKRMSPSSSPTVSARNECVSRTEWHTPTTRSAGSDEPAQMPHGTIAMGLV